MRHALAASLLLAVACAPRATAPTLAYSPVPGRPDLPFSEAVRSGALLFLSGQIGNDSTGKLVPGGIVPETAQALANLRANLERNGSSIGRVIKCTAILADMTEWGRMNSVYGPFFGRNLPARTAIGGVTLVFGARVEFDCVALVGNRT